MNTYAIVYSKEGRQELTYNKWANFDFDLLHREDGPAIEYSNGTKYWYIDGKLHREDGPAIEYANGTSLFFLNGKEYSKQDHYRELNNSNILKILQ